MHIAFHYVNVPFRMTGYSMSGKIRKEVKVTNFVWLRFVKRRMSEIFLFL